MKRYNKIFIAAALFSSLILGSWIVVKAQVVSSPYVLVPSEIRKINGYYAFAVFEKNDTHAKKEIPISDLEYWNYSDPSVKSFLSTGMTGYTLVGAYYGNTYSTSSPVLKDYQYYEAGVDAASSTIYRIKEPNQSVMTITDSSLLQIL